MKIKIAKSGNLYNSSFLPGQFFNSKQDLVKAAKQKITVANDLMNPSEYISFVVQFDDGMYMGDNQGQEGPTLIDGRMFDSADEANRWAAKRAKGRLWKLIKWDTLNDTRTESEYVTPKQSAGHKERHEWMFDHNAPVEPKMKGKDFWH